MGYSDLSLSQFEDICRIQSMDIDSAKKGVLLLSVVYGLDVLDIMAMGGDELSGYYDGLSFLLEPYEPRLLDMDFSGRDMSYGDVCALGSGFVSAVACLSGSGDVSASYGLDVLYTYVHGVRGGVLSDLRRLYVRLLFHPRSHRYLRVIRMVYSYLKDNDLWLS